jgi:hypothetical protein
MTPDEVVVEFVARVESPTRGDPADLVAEDLIQHAAAPQGRSGFMQTLSIIDADLDSPTADIHHGFAPGDLQAG